MKLSPVLHIEGRSLFPEGKKTVFFRVLQNLGGGRYMIHSQGKNLIARSHLLLPPGKTLKASLTPEGWVIQSSQPSPATSRPPMDLFFQALGHRQLPLDPSLLDWFPRHKNSLQKDKSSAALAAHLLKSFPKNLRPLLDKVFALLNEGESKGDEPSQKNLWQLIKYLVPSADQGWNFFPMLWNSGEKQGRFVLRWKKEQTQGHLALKLHLGKKEYGMNLRKNTNAWVLTLFADEEDQLFLDKNKKWYENVLEKGGVKVILETKDLESFDGFGQWQNWSMTEVDHHV